MMPNLTNRQKDVLELLAKGISNKAISHHLNISENTVKVHVTAILKKLDVRNRTQAALALQVNGFTATSQPPVAAVIVEASGVGAQFASQRPETTLNVATQGDPVYPDM